MRSALLLWVGKRAEPSFEALAADYGGRIARQIAFDDVRLKPALGRDGDPRRALAAEAGEIRRHLRPGDWVVALDEHGRQRTTEELSAWLVERLDRNRLVLLIGSDLGLATEIKTEARELFALSRLTLPHQLARVLLLEQLYRGLDFAAGGAYHRGDRDCIV